MNDAANMRAGLVTAAVYNTHRRKRSDPVYRAGDFFRKPRKAQTIEEMAAVMDRLAARQNAVHSA